MRLITKTVILIAQHVNFKTIFVNLSGNYILKIIGETEKLNLQNITISPRLVKPGDCYIDFENNVELIKIALRKGASVVVSESDLSAFSLKNVLFIHVKNLKENISFIVADLFDNPSRKLQIIGITGTNGKTSTATFLHHILQQLNHKASLFSTVQLKINDTKIDFPQKSHNALYINRFLNRLIAEGNCSYCCLETTSLALSKDYFKGVHFFGAVFTNLTHDHLNYHGSMENYFQAKKKLFDYLDEKAFALVNADDNYSNKILSDCKAKKYTFSLQNSQADFYGKLIKESIDGIIVEIEGKEWQFPLKGRFNAYNLLAAYGAAVLSGEDKEKVLQALQSIEPPSGRLQPVKNNKGIHAFVDFAHTPDGLEKALEAVNNIKNKEEAKVILVTGCGGNKDKEKRPIMGKIAVQNSDIAIFTSDNPRDEDPLEIIKAMMFDLTPKEMQAAIIEPDRKLAIEKACQLAKPEDIILVAGKGHEETQEINGEILYFSDQEVLKKLLGTV
jgi:UDP-N-acetylmuramoyl-L-alanyl-D-glutamate--2,6-diaminopimelate ligase